MARATTSPPILRLKRSSQSGQKVMAADWTTVYEETSLHAFFFAGARIDLSPMVAGDVVELRIQAILVEDGSLTTIDTITYTGARPSGRSLATAGYLANIYGVEVQMRQTAGVGLTLMCEFYDAKRIGLE